MDRPGNRVTVGQGSAYDLFLSRELQAAQRRARAWYARRRGETFLKPSRAGVAAGVRQELEADARRLDDPRLRLLPGRFMVIEQAMGLPPGAARGERRAGRVRRTGEGRPVRGRRPGPARCRGRLCRTGRRLSRPRRPRLGHRCGYRGW